MAGGEIKNTLILDVSKFSTALEKAIGGTETLEKQLKSAAKVASDFDKGVAEIGGDLTKFATSFRMLDKTIESLVDRMSGMLGRFDDMSRRSSKAADGIDRIGVATKKVTSINAEQWVKKYADSLDQLSPAIKNAVSSIVEFDKANAASSKSTSDLAGKSIAAKVKMLENERDSNKKILADRQATYAELLALQNEFDGKASALNAKAKRYFGANAGKGAVFRAEAGQYSGIADTARSEAAALQEVIKQIRYKNLGLGESIKLYETQAAEAIKAAQAEKLAQSGAKEVADAAKAAARAAAEAAAESARASRVAAQERMRAAREAASFEREQAQQIAQMWKGMGQLWAASKIEHGYAKSVNAAGDFQREMLVLQGMNTPKEEIDYITKKAWDDSAVLKFASALDLVKGRIAMIGGLPNASRGTLDALMPQAAMAANNIATMTGDHSPQGFENMIRNIAGVIDARGQSRDVEAAKRTIDLIQKIYLGTGRKIDITDIETFLRRDNLGANTMTDEGMAKVVAFLDEAKVSGGHGGGQAGAGVSTVGTAVKMFQKMANGGLMTERAAKEFAEAGLIDTSVMNGKTGKQAMKALREGGLVVSDEANRDPVKALEMVADAAFKYMSSDKNKARYFGDKNVNDEEARRMAMRKFATESGFSVTAQGMLVTAGDRDKMDRAHAQGQKIMSSKGASEMNDDVMKSYAGNIQAFDSALTNLKVTLGTELLPVVTEFVKLLTNVLQAAQKFANENPLPTKLTLLAGAAAGVVMAVRGFSSMFGVVGNLSSLMAALVGHAGKASGATLAAGQAAAQAGQLASGSTSLWGALSSHMKGHFTDVGGYWNDYLKTVRTTTAAAHLATSTGTVGIGSSLSLLGKAVGSTAKLVGKAFMRMIPFVGELLLAWDFAELVGHIEVGGHAVSEWMAKWLDDLLSGASVFWDKFCAMFQGGAARAASLASAAQKEQAWLQRQQANGFNVKDTAAAVAARTPAALALDKLNSPNVDPLTGQAWKVEAPAQKKEDGNPNKPKTGGGGALIGTDTSSTKRQFEDLFLQSLATISGKRNIDNLKLGTLISGDESYAAQAKEAFKENWLGGKFDEAHDPRNRLFKKDKNGGNSLDNLDLQGSYKDKSGKLHTVQEWLDAYEAGKKLEDQIKAVTFAKERAAAMDDEAASASERLTKDAGKETDAMRALKREFARQEAANPAALSDPKYQERKASALMNRARADLDNYAADLEAQVKQMKAKQSSDSNGMPISQKSRTSAEFDQQTAEEGKKYSAVLKGYEQQLEELAKCYSQDSEKYRAALADKERASKIYTEFEKARAKERQEVLKTESDKLADQWHDVVGQLESAQAKWMNNFESGVEAMLDGSNGKFKNWSDAAKGFIRSALLDVRSMMLKDLMATPAKMITGWMKDMTGGLFGAIGVGNAKNAAGNVASVGAGAGADAAAKKLGESMTSAGVAAQANAAMTQTATVAKQGETAATTANTGATAANTGTTAINTGATAVNTGATSVNAAATSVNTATTSVNSVVTGVNTVATTTNTVATTANTTSTLSETLAKWWDAIATKAAAAAKTMGFANGGAFGAGITAFADGGAFTNGMFDSPTPFMFANGASFAPGVMGEAGPEAVMPLSRDGKGRLGVSVHGTTESETGINVSIQVNVDSSGGSDTKSSGDSAGNWTDLANKIKGVVVEQLVTQSRPGGVLYK